VRINCLTSIQTSSYTPTMMRLTIAAMFLSACAVRPSPVEVPNLDIPQTLAVALAPLGEVTPLSVPITNRGTASTTVRIAVTGDITAPSAVVIEPGQTRTLRVTVRPTSVNDTAASLRFTTDYQTTVRNIDITVVVDVDADGEASLAAGGSDCDDRDPAVFSGAVERCNGVDDDCDGRIDADAVDVLTFFADSDADGWGVVAVTTQRCSVPARFSPRSGDCDDANSGINPGVTEQFYDGIDQNCDGESDFDADADGVDAAAFGGMDCRDTDDASFPGAIERPGDGLDQDCDGAVDERPPRLGELVITEVHPSPVTGPAFVELASQILGVLALDGIEVIAAESLVVPRNTNIEPLSTFVLCDAPADFCDAVAPLLAFDGVSELKIGLPLLDSVALELLPWASGISAQWPDIPDSDANDNADGWCAAPESSDFPTTPGDITASCTQ
jgi:hypothetical protein